MNISNIPSSISVGPVQFHLYGLLLGIGFVIIYFVIDKRYKSKIKTIDYVLVAFLSILGARALFIIHNMERFIEDPLFFFRLTGGGFALFGALIGLLIGCYIVTKKRGLFFLQVTDHLFTYVPLVQAIGRFGNFFNQELYGKPTDNWWGIFIAEENRLPGYEGYTHFQPAFLFEVILDLLNFLILKYLFKDAKEGTKTAIFFLNYGIIRLLVNRVRIDKEYFFFIETSDLLALVSILLSILLLSYLYSSEVKQIFR